MHGKHKQKWWQRRVSLTPPPMTNEDIAYVCEDTADLLDGHWIQGSWYSEQQEAYCMEGAMAAALGLVDVVDDLDGFGDSGLRSVLTQCPVYAAVQETLALEYNDYEDYDWGELPNWNDHDGRTEAEVVDILRATAKRMLGIPADQMRSTP